MDSFILLNRELETMASEVLKISNEKNQLIAQDLLICELEIFFKHSLLELAMSAKVYDFVCLAPVQQLLTDVWYDKINSYVSNWQIFLGYLCFPSLLSSISYFRSDVNTLENITELNEQKIEEKIETEERKKSIQPKLKNSKDEKEKEEGLNIPNKELSYRCTKHRLTGIYRIYSFHNAPIIKFINHFIAFICFLTLFSFFLLFDYYPDKEVSSTIISRKLKDKNKILYMTITELILIISVAIYHLGEIEQFLVIKTFDNKFLTKLRDFYGDKWNIFDLFLFFTFYIGLCVRLLPIYGNIVYFGGESCYEVARVLYSVDLILWYIRILQKVSCLTFWGPKIIIIKAMINKLFYYVVLILIFLIPFSTTVESILHKTQKPSLAVLVNSINRTFWSMFGELLGILSEFNEFKCQNQENTTDPTDFIHDVCTLNISTLFLYGSFAFYTVTCNLLLLNMIIATFASTVEEIERDSTKFYRFHRLEGIKEFADKSIIPAPFVIIEYIIRVVKYARNYINGELEESRDSFRIENLEVHQKEFYTNFETTSRDQFYISNYLNYEIKMFDKNEDFINTVRRLEDNLNLFKIWTHEQLNEKFLFLNRSMESVVKKLDTQRRDDY